ncbi:MAG: CoA-binding protein [Verrucomicrobiota bacterium]|nr:CoA-binding protein [Limisphaera sp.]MDW8382383.1 CoA-binding protein [Verrucomicrobiota bacterium]
MALECEWPRLGATPMEIQQLLATARTIAVVGCSDKPERDSYRVAQYLLQQGYEIVPVNPNVKEVLGRPAYADLRQVPGRMDIVGIFRRPEAVPKIVEAAVARGDRAVWMQEGIVHNAAAERAFAAGLQVVMNRCLAKEHRRWRAAQPEATRTSSTNPTG